MLSRESKEPRRASGWFTKIFDKSAAISINTPFNTARRKSSGAALAANLTHESRILDNVSHSPPSPSHLVSPVTDNTTANTDTIRKSSGLAAYTRRRKSNLNLTLRTNDPPPILSLHLPSPNMATDFAGAPPDTLPSPQVHERERAGSVSVGNMAGSPIENGAGPANAAGQPPGSAPDTTPPGPTDGGDPEVSRQVNEVLTSDVGLVTMLNRLKQSISSAKVC
ncbi:hypothetical protein F4810DRAFT_31300 [Camillea tinctor]|nr:hypothetical protein F4810DRAFT_31300 [Camillea tinctor]